MTEVSWPANLGASVRDRWHIDPDVVFLNHGSFGACPKDILDYQRELQTRLERQPVRFMAGELEPMLDDVRAALGALIQTAADNIALVSNATTGVNTVLRSLKLDAGDAILITDHGYNACNNAARFVAERAGATVQVARIPIPVSGPSDIVDAIVGTANEQTRLAIIDHVTSPTGIVFPVQEIIARLGERGIETLVDGAHAPGMLPLNLDDLGATYYTGNCHKWLCTPKGAAFLYVTPDRQKTVRPLVISHGANATRDRTRFRLEFDWTGTDDPTPWLCIPKCIEWLDGLLGGLAALQRRNHNLAVMAQSLLADLGFTPVAPPQLLGSLAAVVMPGAPQVGNFVYDVLQRELLETQQIEVPVFAFGAPPKRLLRVSAQAYNHREEYERLAAALGPLAPSPSSSL